MKCFTNQFQSVESLDYCIRFKFQNWTSISLFFWPMNICVVFIWQLSYVLLRKPSMLMSEYIITWFRSHILYCAIFMFFRTNHSSCPPLPLCVYQIHIFIFYWNFQKCPLTFLFPVYVQHIIDFYSDFLFLAISIILFDDSQSSFKTVAAPQNQRYIHL